MKNKIKVIIVALILVVLAAGYSIIDKNNAIYDTDVDSSDYGSLELEKRGNVNQEFVTFEERLDGLAVKLTASGNIDNIEVGYELEEKETGKIVSEGTASLAELKNGKFFKFKFEQVTGCKDKVYVFHMHVDKCDEDSRIIVCVTDRAEDATSLLVNGEVRDSTIVLRTITHRFDIETFIVTICFIIYIVLFMRWLYKLFKQ